MTVKLGRNDPCHCGSGKKYKKCHLAADEAQVQEVAVARAMDRAAGIINDFSSPFAPGPAAALPVLPNLPKLPELTPEQQAEYAAYEAFHAQWSSADYAGRLALFEEQLAAGMPLEDDAFDLLATLFDQSGEHNDRDRFWSLTEQFREQAAEMAERDAIWVLSWLVEDAVTRQLYDRLPPLVDRLADAAPTNVDEMFRLLDMLLFHGQTEVAVAVMTRAWPALSVTPGITGYGLGEFVGLLAMLQIADYAAHAPDPRPDDRALLDRLEPLGTLDQEGIALALGALTRTDPAWTPADFLHDPVAHTQSTTTAPPWEDDDDLSDEDLATIDDLIRHPEEIDGEEVAELLGIDDDDAPDDEHLPPPPPVLVAPVGALPTVGCAALHRNLVALTVEWAAHIARTSAIPYGRVELARDVLIAYLDDQPVGRNNQAILLPARGAVNKWVNAFLSPLSGRYYKGAAFFALLPSYISFLEAQGLASRDQARRARDEIKTLKKHLRRISDEAVHDSLLNAFVDEPGV